MIWKARTMVASVAMVGLATLTTACDDGSSAQTKADTNSQVLRASVSHETGNAPTIQANRANQPAPAAKKAASGQDATGKEPKIQLEFNEHDFGKLHSREPVTVMVPFKNVGQRTLHLNRISTSCGCTTAKLDKMSFEPGEGDIIEVTYTPKSTGKRTSKLVTISSNDPDNAIQRVKITAWLIEPSRLEPNRLQVGQIKAGQEHEAKFQVISPDTELEIVKIEDESGLLSFEIEDANKLDDKTFPGRKTLNAKISGQAPTGKLALPFKVTTMAAVDTGSERIETVLNGIILGHVRGDLLTEPRFLRVRNVEKEQDFEVRTLVYSESGQDFSITKVALEDSMLEDVKVSYEQADKAESGRDGWWVVLNGNTGNTTGAFRGTVIIETSLPSEGPKKVQYNGVIRRTAPPTRTSSR